MLASARRKRPLPKISFALPSYHAFTVVWAFAECVGYLFGPDESLLRVE
jgi:hypothetical protein